MIQPRYNLEDYITPGDLGKEPLRLIETIGELGQAILLHRFQSFKSWNEMVDHYQAILDGHVYRPGLTGEAGGRDAVHTILRLQAYERFRRANLQDALDRYLADRKHINHQTAADPNCF